MNPYLPYYRGRFALLWHELPASHGLGNFPCSMPDATSLAVEPTYGPKHGHTKQNASPICPSPSWKSSSPISPSNDSHWDLLLELETGELATWRLPAAPLAELFRVGSDFNARRLPDHRSHYLEYEGPISDKRGSVARVAAGVYSAIRIEKDSHENETVEILSSLQSSSQGDSRPLACNFDHWLSTEGLNEHLRPSFDRYLAIAMAIFADSKIIIRLTAAGSSDHNRMKIVSNVDSEHLRKP